MIRAVPRQVMVSRWAVEIDGHHATIERLENYLNNSLRKNTDTFVGKLRNIAVLRSQLWDKVDEPSLVGQLAQAELAVLQGLTKLSGGASTLTAGTIIELGPGDCIVRQMRTSVNTVTVLSREIDEVSEFRARLDVIRQHDALIGATIELSGSPDWIKIYKAMEYLEEYYGGEKRLKDARPNDWPALKRIKRTCQLVRHRARAFEKLDRPYNLFEAEKFLQEILKKIISSLYAPVVPAVIDFRVVKKDYSDSEQIGLRPLMLVNGEVSEVAFVGDTMTSINQ